MDDQGEMGNISACLLISRGHLLFGTKKQVEIWGKELIFPPSNDLPSDIICWVYFC